jgi:hypothetical protein
MVRKQKLEGQGTLFLVHPPQAGLLEGFSSGLVALGNYVTKCLSRCRVTLLDLGGVPLQMVNSAVAEAVRNASEPLFVGITATTATYQAALQVAQAFKSAAPAAVVVLGGHHCSAQDEIILTMHHFVDCVVRGEGELALVDLVQNYPNFEGVAGLSFRQGSQIRRNQQGRLLDQQALDELAPSFQGWGIKSAPGKFGHTTYVSARGCPLGCAFCSVANQRVRAKSVDAVVRDLKQLVQIMGFRNIAIEDNFFAQSAKRTIGLCKAIGHLQHESRFRWDCQTRVESCQRQEVMEAIEQAGCEAVYLGVESFDPEQLLYLKKTPSPGIYLDLLINKVVPWLMASRVNCFINVQLGLPGEAEHHRQQTLTQLRCLGRLACDVGREISIFPQLHVVYPGTRHFLDALNERRFGTDGGSIFERFTRWETGQQPVLHWLGEHFAHGTGGIPEGILETIALRNGKFVVDSFAVLQIVNYLHAMEQIPGIKVFKYGKFITLSGREHV